MKPINKILVFIVCLVLGIVIAAQGRTVYEFEKRKDILRISYEEMLAVLEKDKIENNRLREYIDMLYDKKASYIEHVAEHNENGLLQEQLIFNKNLAGLTDVIGSGIVITLDDAFERRYVNPQTLIIHDLDITILINELKVAGATAISVNDERILDISEQICAGPTILINKNRYATPYIIKAIGNSDILYDKIISSERYMIMLNDGIRINIEKNNDIIIKGYKGKIGSLISGLKVVENEN